MTAPTVDRTAIERLRAEQIGLAETASKRIAQALADAAEVLSPEQRRKVADWMAHGGRGCPGIMVEGPRIDGSSWATVSS